MFSMILHATTTNAINLQFVFATLTLNGCGLVIANLIIILNLVKFVKNHFLFVLIVLRRYLIEFEITQDLI